jgi:aspartyl-tRNA(Asn)/glutamyl-tRNA(Gln) amidotransferase subunit C
MAITRATVLHVSRLARLNLEESEVDAMLSDLGRIVGYIDQLSELDTSDIPATAQIAVTAAPRRADIAEASLDTELALSQGPRVHDGGFAVPAFVDEG